MKQHRNGQRVINWHRPYNHTQLSQGYLRCRETAWQREFADDSMACNDEWYDDAFYYDQWPAHGGECLDYACYVAHALLEQEAPQGPFRQFFMQRGWLTPPLPHSSSPAEVVVHSAALAEQLADYRRQLLGPRVHAEGLPAAARQAIADTDLRPLQAIAAGSPEGCAAALNLLLFRPFWIRSLSSWEPQGTSGRDRIVALVAHLLVHYPVPPFLYREWMSELEPDHLKWLCWTILLGQGHSLHLAARHFGWELPRRHQHHLYQAPAQVTGTEACLYAELLRLGGSVVEFRRLRLAEPFAIDPTEPSADPHFLAFWRSSALWLIQHRQELNDEQAQGALYWAMHQYAEARRVEGQPFTLIGRSVQRVLAASRAYQVYYQNIYGVARAYSAPQRWTGQGWNWSWEDAERNEWSATELTTSEELAAEGQAMHHCVAGYAGQCAVGRAAIVSLCCNGVRRVTIEVDLLTRRVVQARGNYNRNPSTADQAALEYWWRTIINGRPEARAGEVSAGWQQPEG
jgi:hypothetical protein